MKIIITENQLKLIKENVSNKARQILFNRIKSVGFIETSKTVGDEKNLMKILNIDSPMKFLHLFDDLDVVKSEQEPDLTLFRYKPKYNLIVYNRTYDNVDFNYFEIWEVLANVFNLKYDEIQELLKKWLFEVYNLTGVKTVDSVVPFSVELFEVYNLTGVKTDLFDAYGWTKVV